MHLPTKPTDRPVTEGAIASYWWEDNGILVSLSKDPKRTVENIAGNVALVKELTGNQPVPLLIYLCKSPIPDKAARKFSTEQLPVIYSAMAMVSTSGLAEFIMNLLFRLKPAPIPMRSFKSDVEAKEWLKRYL